MKISSRWLTLGIAVLFALSGTTGTVTAQDGGSSFDLAIVAANCKRMPTGFPFQGGDCVPANHVSITVTTATGELLGSCIPPLTDTAEIIASCSIPVPFGMAVIVTEDLDTVPPGYTPTMNSQPFDVPVSPPQGEFGGPVFINLPTEATTTNNTETSLDVGLVGNAQSWIVPFAPGWGDTTTGRLMFGAQVRNATDTTVWIEAVFSATTAQGNPIQCFGLTGPNIWESIAPGDTAVVTCAGPIVPRTTEGIRVLAQVWNTTSVSARSETFSATGVTFAPSPALSSPMDTTYEASALVHSIRSYRTDAMLLFRFYDTQGVQVGTCSSDWVTTSPDGPQQVSCSYPLHIDTTQAQPVRVEVESQPPIRF